MYKVNEKFLNYYGNHVPGITSFNKNHLLNHGVKKKHIIKEKVNSISIKNLIKKYGLKKLDLLYIDTEGYDGKIVLDFLKTKSLHPIIIFEFIHIENRIFKNVIKKLLLSTKESLYAGIREFKAGNRIGDISYSIQDYVESNGFAVVRDLVGHGIGESLHEDPQIPNFGVKGTGDVIKEGMCFAIEPMVTMKSYEVFTKKDDWTICTKDGSLAAHFEHTITIMDNGAKILTK